MIDDVQNRVGRVLLQPILKIVAKSVVAYKNAPSCFRTNIGLSNPSRNTTVAPIALGGDLLGQQFLDHRRYRS